MWTVFGALWQKHSFCAVMHTQAGDGPSHKQESCLGIPLLTDLWELGLCRRVCRDLHNTPLIKKRCSAHELTSTRTVHVTLRNDFVLAPLFFISLVKLTSGLFRTSLGPLDFALFAMYVV